MKLDLQLDSEQIRAEVSRILNSRSFEGSMILRDFLNFIVDETLTGNEEGLKEYVIATSVLKKNEDFNPQLSAIVRIHARRLRKRLDDYYVQEGRDDPIRISVPKGRYIPVFDVNGPMEIEQRTIFAREGDWKPVLAVLPCNVLNRPEEIAFISTVLFRDLSMKLSRAGEIGVMPYDSARRAFEEIGDYRDFGTRMDVDYIITGTSLKEGERIKFTIELIALHKVQLLWAESFYLRLDDKFETRDFNNIIRKVIAMTCGYRGLVYQDLYTSVKPGDYGKYYALYWHHYYHSLFTEEAFKVAMNAVEAGLEKNPGNSLLLAFKGELLLNLLVMDADRETDYLKAGTEFVRQAIGINQNCQHAFQVMGWAHVLRKDKDEFIRAIERSMAINPNDVMYSGSAGFAYVCMGEYEKGLDLMSDALSLNPYYPWNLSVSFCLYYMVHGEFGEALYWARLINRSAFFWDPLLRCSVLGHMQKLDEAGEAYRQLLTLKPDFAEKATALVSVFLLDTDLQASILEGLRLAGMKQEPD